MIQGYSKYYFLGIGGIGMSSLARYFNTKGYDVGGYDRAETKLTKNLISEGIDVVFDPSVGAVPERYVSTNKTLIVMTPAIPQDHEQLVYFRTHNYTIIKRSELLGMITKKNKAICIAGTHGKTTTSTITAHLLHQSHVECNAFLGGISNNYNSNLILSNQSSYVVVEADEYDRSFHNLNPFMAVITSVEPDHLDIYGSYEAVIQSFVHFTSLIQPGGILLLHESVSLQPILNKGVKKYTYGLHSNSDFYAHNIRKKENSITFDFIAPTETIYDIKLNVPIMINVVNSVAAIAMAWLSGVTSEEIRTAMSIFSGIYRRFDFVLQLPDVVYIDDYAHHPSELDASISSIRTLFPNKKITGIFQPHLYSRTQSFSSAFAQSLSALDDLILLDIYPARELPIEGVSSDLILKDVQLKEKKMSTKEDVVKELEKREIEVLVTFGAGDIENIVPTIKEYLKKRFPKQKIVPND